MTKNLIPIIAKELGVEIGEEFLIGDCNTRYRFTKKNLQVNAANKLWLNSDIKFNDFFKDGITKPPFEPKYNEAYWTYVNRSFIVTEDIWQDMCIDWTRKNAGVVFRTKEEAIDARPEKFKELTGKDWEE